MVIKKIQLENFRNYSKCDLKLNSSINVLYGKNAQGKTNILEAIYLCSMGKSHRTSKNSELIKFDENYFKCQVFLDDNGYDKNIEYLYLNNKKEISINEIKINKLGDFVGKLKTVLFAPEHLDIIKDGPSYRRKFVDMCICQVDNKYFYNLQLYNKIIKQKSALLKNINKSNNNDILNIELDIWNEQLASVMVDIFEKRKYFIKDFSNLLSTRHVNLTNEDDVLSINYLSKLSELYNKKKYIFIGNIINKLNEIKQKECAAGLILFGTHKDEYEILLNNKEIKIFGSQGQIRTSVLALKLAEMDYIKIKTECEPVLLLDDVFSELDEYRQQYLIDTVKDKQVIITCTSRDVISLNKVNCTFIEIKSGNIIQI